MGNDLNLIRDIAGNYFKHAFISLGLTEDKVDYILGSDVYNKDYWEKVINISKNTSIKRMLRCTTVMGRKEGEGNDCSFIMYPAMQAADIFELGMDVACSGIDQRKAHMLARDAAEKLKWDKPSCIHTPLLIGLQGPQAAEKSFDENQELNVEISSKMSKSIPQSSILVHDSPEDIASKLKNAYCPPKIVKNNPILELARLIIYPENDLLEIPRPAKYGGPETFESFENLAKTYSEGKIHPLDLKNGVTNSLTEILRPVREHFSKNPETLEKMLKIEITR